MRACSDSGVSSRRGGAGSRSRGQWRNLGQRRDAIDQAVTLDTTVVNDPGFGDQDSALGEAGEPSDGVATRNDNGSSFTIAMELTAGETVRVDLYLQNEGTATTSAVLALNPPKNIDVDVTETLVSALGVTLTSGQNGVEEAQLGRNQWLLSLSGNTGDGADDGVTILTRPTRLIKPRSYTITGRSFQIERQLRGMHWI